MPEVVGTLRPPRLGTAPASPVTGQVYYDTASNLLCYWNGAVWMATPRAPFIICTNIAQGAFPRTINFTLPVAVASALLVVSLTAYPSAVGAFQVGYTIDGAQAGAINMYGNAVAHMTLPLGIKQVTSLTAGAHALGLRNDLNASMDTTDFVSAYLHITG